MKESIANANALSERGLREITAGITAENIRNFAYVNDLEIVGGIKGIILDFFGLGAQNFYRTAPTESVRFGKQGFLHVVPYTNPWCWLNNSAYSYALSVLNVVTQKYALASAPLVVCGASMGGLSALNFTLRSEKVPVACVTNCPVCDLVAHYAEHDDMPRTIYSAFYGDGDFAKAVLASSPYHHAAEMPTSTSYVLLQCDEDDDVHPYVHAERFVPLMRQTGHSVEYVIVPNSGHCQLNEKYLDTYYQKIEQGFGR